MYPMDKIPPGAINEGGEPDREPCGCCGGEGFVYEQHTITREMALDAGDEQLEGEVLYDRQRCTACGGAGAT